MKTIEEKAKEFAENYERGAYHEGVIDGYEAGAEEQQEIDIEKVCEWMTKAIDQWNESAHHHQAYCYIDRDGAIRKFRKAMEE